MCLPVLLQSNPSSRHPCLQGTQHHQHFEVSIPGHGGYGRILMRYVTMYVFKSWKAYKSTAYCTYCGGSARMLCTVEIKPHSSLTATCSCLKLHSQLAEQSFNASKKKRVLRFALSYNWGLRTKWACSQAAPGESLSPLNDQKPVWPVGNCCCCWNEVLVLPGVRVKLRRFLILARCRLVEWRQAACLDEKQAGRGDEA